MNVKILGKGCPKCKRLEELTREVVDELGIAVEIEKVTDINAIMAYDILSTPGLVVNETLVSYGRIPQKEEIREWLQMVDLS
ncbi:MAG: TM0996/MTH895 family glutaredoxin-like protein [Anaerolineae bacterium]|jgi:small redox-active disulfide protein 2|nr:TM0996/MTH895 family glutaredoxin-like protein [Anaerolineae bacterium]